MIRLKKKQDNLENQEELDFGTSVDDEEEEVERTFSLVKMNNILFFFICLAIGSFIVSGTIITAIGCHNMTVYGTFSAEESRLIPKDGYDTRRIVNGQRVKIEKKTTKAVIQEFIDEYFYKKIDDLINNHPVETAEPIKTVDHRDTNLDINKNKESNIDNKPAVVVSKTDTASTTTVDNKNNKDNKQETSLPKDQSLKEVYSYNKDAIAWLSVDSTAINNVVMQTIDDEEFYLKKNEKGHYSAAGCLILDTDSIVGKGTKSTGYSTKPSTNLIIHGHHMKNGTMFGDLDKYKDQSYGNSHKIIKLTTLEESREYQVISVFYSQVYDVSMDVFKYYQFFQADTQAEFDSWYNSIKGLSIYDTGVTASFGDEFITLSTCAYQTDDGRFVVVGKRVK